MKIMLPLAALAAGLLIVPTVQAQSASRTVRVADLRLDTATGAATLDRRIAIAVKDACGSLASYDRAGRKAIAVCRVETTGQVLAQRDALVASARQMAATVSLADATATR